MTTTSDLIAQLERLGGEFAQTIAPLADEQAIRAAQAQFLGKKGQVSEVMKALGRLPPADRPLVGQAANQVKDAIAQAVEARLAALAAARRQADLARTLDVTLPGRPVGGGHLHLLTQVRLELVGIFAELGFAVAEGPQVETDWHTFEALAIPKDHPARDMQDTFYIADEIVLRTHTSPVQIRTMQAHPPPIRIVAPGVVYRRDDDATHSPMFSQIEGLVVDEGVRVSDLKGVLLHFVNRFFGGAGGAGGGGLDVRLRPSYFPFVEPGVEIDMSCAFCAGAGCRLCKGTGWIEIGGAGMVDPDVFGHVGIDAERYTGFAFGMGIERMAMLRHGVNDIKLYYEGDLRFLDQF
ncbi:MAG: phenylalanine--tRNA ligase subunit alpha [Kofleriaceae bacterium]|nr:phenylalanine--tRNA ligase subunit alpha [Kofleriaceae bacterium]MCL4228408.1 phenylalanine--tRNA ligase subunit alpha [Myxococcales bacterium]